jgi:hypothetical protein
VRAFLPFLCFPSFASFTPHHTTPHHPSNPPSWAHPVPLSSQKLQQNHNDNNQPEPVSKQDMDMDMDMDM